MHAEAPTSMKTVYQKAYPAVFFTEIDAEFAVFVGVDEVL